MLKPDRHALVDIIITDPGISTQNVKTVEELGIDLIIAR